MKMRFSIVLATMAIIIGAGASARATEVTFEFTNLTSFQPGYTIVNGGYGLTLLDPVGSSPAPGNFQTDPVDGIYLTTNVSPNPGFSMQISGGALDFERYEISFINPGTTGTFSLAGGTGASTGNVIAPAGVYAFNGSYSIAPGNTVVLSSNFTSGTLFIFKSITFSTPVPEPSTYVLGAIVTGVTAFAVRRRKATQGV